MYKWKSVALKTLSTSEAGITSSPYCGRVLAATVASGKTLVKSAANAAAFGGRRTGSEDSALSKNASQSAVASGTWTRQGITCPSTIACRQFAAGLNG